MSATAMAEPWVTTAEIAKHLSKPRSWIFNNYKRMEIPHIKIGNQLRFRRSEVDEWAELQSTEYEFVEQCLDAAGDAVVDLERSDGTVSSEKVGHLVLKTFGQRLPGPEYNAYCRDGNRLNNNLENLYRAERQGVPATAK